MTLRTALNALLSSEDFHALEARLRRVSAFHILGIDTRELSHAALLGWLLDPRSSHGMGAEPLRRFVLLAARGDPSEETLDAVDIDQLDLADALVETERWIDVPGKQLRRRLDILVSITLPGSDEPSPIAVVEYKVDASEGDGQTADYAAWAATKRLQVGLRRALPLQVYVCPVVRDDRAPAPPFVTIGYDATLSWADGVDTLEKTTQAQLLLDEWRACLLARNDVVDEEQGTLSAKLVQEHGAAIRALRSAETASLAAFQHVLDQHAEALTQLGIRVGRRGGASKGHSATVALEREALEGALSVGTWSVTGGGGSVRAVYVPFVREVAAWTDTQVRLSGLCLQLFAERPARGRFAIVLEVTGDVPSTTREGSRAIRLEVAEAVRAALRETDPDLPFRHSATLVRFSVDVPNVVDIDRDTDENAIPHREELQRIATRISGLEETLRAWTAGSLRPLLDRERSRTG